MHCCKAKDYDKWCADLPTVYRSKIGEEYCVFHAPTEDKGQTPEKFNQLVFDRIQSTKKNEEICNLKGTFFPWEIIFSHFNKENPFPIIDFIYAKFKDHADFEGSYFNTYVNFSGVVFEDWANFNNARFKHGARFEKAAFSGGAWFSGARFTDYPTFDEVTFHNNVYFHDTDFEGGASFKSTIFHSRVHFKKAVFKKATFFNLCSAEKPIIFEKVDLSLVSFLDTDPLNLNFSDHRWPRHRGRNVLFDELQIKKELSWKESLKYDEPPSYDKVEYLYRKLKQKYKGEYNELEASNWHYGEKEMFRKKKWWRRFNPISFSSLYWASSGYGERPLRAGIVLIFLFAGVTFSMNVLGITSINGHEIFGVKEIKGFYSLFNSKKFWLLINNSIQNVLFIKETYFKPETLSGSILQTILSKLLIPIQVALFVLALRNKFRR